MCDFGGAITHGVTGDVNAVSGLYDSLAYECTMYGGNSGNSSIDTTCDSISDRDSESTIQQRSS